MSSIGFGCEGDYSKKKRRVIECNIKYIILLKYYDL